MSDAFRQKVLSTGVLPAGARVIAAVSGGADSLALLHTLLSLKQVVPLQEVAALHVHHGLRGAEADRDEAHVRALCEKWEVPYTDYRIDVATEARRTHEGLEECGRRLRYSIYREWTEKGWLVATGHTASDVAETTLLHMTRGCGLSGLAGIAPVRDGVCRPLLNCLRKDTEDYCREHKIDFVFDSTNGETAFSRNRVRLEVLPQLQKINPQVESAIKRMADIVREETVFLDEQAALWLEKSRDEQGNIKRHVLAKAPEVLAIRALRMAFPSTNASREHWQGINALLTEDGAVTLPTGLTVRTVGERLIAENEAVSVTPFRMPLTIGEPFTVGKTAYIAYLLSAEKFFQLQNVHKKLFSFSLSYDIIKGSLTVRQRRNGDCYHPVNRPPKKLKDLFNEAGLSRSEKETIPILCDDEGIVFIPRFGCAERVRITSETKRVLLLLPEAEAVAKYVKGETLREYV